ncbi:MAG: hypothetical protein GF418_07550 [Chitinivibrionales bacterium]|nr:hypothetical protein [Chitinivibrionales bacterium]MBD3395467.1 hypothetical protein [Chitinivibrionales bacterium]
MSKVTSFSRCFLAACCLWAVCVHGATEKRGVIDQAERWTVEQSPYIVSDDILVTQNARLYIAPGVTVYVGKPHSYDKRIRQIDHLDSFTVSIRVEGTLTCAGRRENRITIVGQYTDSAQCDWYGLVLDGALSDETEIGFTDIAGACHGLMVRRGSPLVHHSVFEYNNVGLTFKEGSGAKILNCVVAHNFATGVRIEKANPILLNNLIVFNRNNGVWSDGVSHFTLEYNCIYGNIDGDLVGCDPRLGILSDINKNKDSVDYKHNLVADPVFAGTAAESLAVEHDVSLPERKSQVIDTTLAKVLYESLPDSIPFRRPTAAAALRYVLSTYSPCIDAGKKGRIYKDPDNSRSDMGVHGGPEFFQLD